MSTRGTSVADHPTRQGRDEGSGARGANRRFHRRFLAEDLETRRVLEELVAELVLGGVGETVVANAELILAEVLNNVVEHAYAAGTGPVELTVERRDDGLECVVADEGKPLPPGMVPGDDVPAQADPDSLPEGGFGWHIIRCLTSNLAYQREGGINRLMLHVPWTD